MKEDKSEVIATSNDLCNPNQTILIVGEDDHVLIHSEKKVNQCFFTPNPQFFNKFITHSGFVVFHFFNKIPQKSIGNRSN